MAAQPLAAAVRQHVRLGLIRPITFPDGSQAEVCHQHADDTSLHVLGLQDVTATIQGPVNTFCAASGAVINISKTTAMDLTPLDPFSGAHQPTGITFVEPAHPIKHLGIHLTANGDLNARQTYEAILATIQARINRWSARSLTLLGRAHVAKQVLAATFTYHATFVRPPKDLLGRLSVLIRSFVAGAPPGTRGMLFPSRYVHALTPDEGGIKMVDVEAMVTGLQAKIVPRYLEPEDLYWKRLVAMRLKQTDIQRSLAYGARILFIDRPLRLLDNLPERTQA